MAYFTSTSIAKSGHRIWHNEHPMQSSKLATTGGQPTSCVKTFFGHSAEQIPHCLQSFSLIKMLISFFIEIPPYLLTVYG
jgi:predicted HD phosphohydrolase